MTPNFLLFEQFKVALRDFGVKVKYLAPGPDSFFHEETVDLRRGEDDHQVRPENIIAFRALSRSERRRFWKAKK